MRMEAKSYGRRVRDGRPLRHMLMKIEAEQKQEIVTEEPNL